MTIEALESAQYNNAQELKAAIRKITGNRTTALTRSYCAIQLDGQFFHHATFENPDKSRDVEFLQKYLKTDLRVDVDTNTVAAMNAMDGSPLGAMGTTELLFLGAPSEAFGQMQDDLIDAGLYTEELEMSIVSTLGGILNYAAFAEMERPILVLAMHSKQTEFFICHEGRLDLSKQINFGFDQIPQGDVSQEEAIAALEPLLKDLQSSTSFYELKQGDMLRKLFFINFPKQLEFVEQHLSDALGLELIKPNYEEWLATCEITPGKGVDMAGLGSRWLSLFSLMCD